MPRISVQRVVRIPRRTGRKSFPWFPPAPAAELQGQLSSSSSASTNAIDEMLALPALLLGAGGNQGKDYGPVRLGNPGLRAER